MPMVIRNQTRYDQGQAFAKRYDFFWDSLDKRQRWLSVCMYHFYWADTQDDYYLGIAEYIQDVIWKHEKEATA